MSQTIVAEINHAIGAQGVVSTECKLIVSEYGELIWNLLVSGVRFSCFPIFFKFFFSTLKYIATDWKLRMFYTMICRYDLIKFARNLVYACSTGLSM